MDMEYFNLSIKEVVDKTKKNELSCEQLAHYYLDRIKKYGLKNDLNCVLKINENAIEEARKLDCLDEISKSSLPLCGAMVLVKDNIDVKGMPTTAGSVAFKDNIAKNDATVIKLLRDKGAVILGKTNMTEFANFLTQGMPGGFSSLGGQVINAYDPGKDPSGSSSGSAVAMSAGLCTFSVGTDTSFSVVGCATENGVVGFKPSIGKISVEGIIPITHHFDSAGFFTKNMDDMIYLYESLFEETIEKAALCNKLLINDFNSQIVSKEQMARYDKMLEKLENSGYRFDNIKGENTSNLKELMMRCFASELQEYLAYNNNKLTIEEILDVYKDDMGKYAPYGIEYLEKSNEYRHSDENENEIKVICEDKEKKRKQVLNELEGFDACLMTGPTCMMHYVGVPSISVPFTTSDADGFPRSMILYAKDEMHLLRFAKIVDEFKDNISCTNYVTNSRNCS